MSLLRNPFILALTALAVSAGQAFCQDNSEYESATHPSVISQIEEAGFIHVNIPDALMPVLSYNESAPKPQAKDEDKIDQSKQTAKVGYRVQVFDDNNARTAQTQAQERKKMIENRFPEFRAYVQFNSPYWRVKVGDFRTRSEAEAALGAIRAAFPSIGSQLRVVRDKINTRLF